jgi:GT2 family glycosyltransferase/tetratricopeptide (TPR) repeat protein/SAM-dependent methyltransferase
VPGDHDPLIAELVALVPPTARRVLDVGCGTGRLGRALKARQEAEVFGLEVDPKLASVALGQLDRVVLGDADAPGAPFTEGQFDCIVCSDLLPYLREPGEFLRRARGWLAPEGRFVAAVPNVRYHHIIRDLLEGRWSYRLDGPVPRPQLRFFTRRETEKLFYRAGFGIPALHSAPGLDLQAWRERGRPGEVKVGPLAIAGLSAGEAEEFYVARYLVSARPAPAADYGLTSIVIVTHNELAYTRECLDGIRARTDEPYELIVVDNGSTDGTPAYLQRLGSVRVIANPDNRGFPAAANQGIRAARGSQVLLLNNDTIPTTGWLGRMLAALYSGPAVALVGPCSNCVSGEQQVPVGYDEDLVGLDGFAWDWGKAHAGVTEQTDRLVGFCLLMRRELVDRIGLLDEQFGVGCFEDDDYCLRALEAGYKAVVARDAFVHHFGSRTFQARGVDFAALMRHNHRLFCEKWQPNKAAVQSPTREQTNVSVSPYQLRAVPEGGLLLERTEPVLSLCMIVRNSARTLAACLESIRPWVDEMVVVDTGSQDETAAIAAELGARVFHFPWCDSFARARNESLRHAHGRWVFWMDADDVIDEANGRKLRELLGREHEPATLGYVMQVHCPGPGEEGQADVTVVDHVKLFRNDEALRFEGRIHEQILPAIRRAGGEVAWTDIHVVHAGYDHSPEGQEKKLKRDLHLLNLELAEQPNHPFTLFNLGMTHADQGEHARAATFLRRSIEQAGPGESHLRKAYALLVACYAELGEHGAAGATCERALELFPRDEELRFRQAMLLHSHGALAEAARAYEELLTNPDERHFSSVDQGIRGFKTRHNLAVVFQDMGEFKSAEEVWRHVLEEMPHYRPSIRGLGELLLSQGKYAEGLDLVDLLLSDPPVRGEGLILHGQIAAAQGDVAQARQLLEEAAAQEVGDGEALRVLARVLFEQGTPAEAEGVLKRLLERDPTDGATHFNLGTVYLRQGQPGQAAETYRRSLEHRPKWAPTYVQLGHAFRQADQPAKAVAAWEEALRLEPANAEAAQALAEARREQRRRVG